MQDITNKRMTARPITKIWLQLGKHITPTFTVPWATIGTREDRDRDRDIGNGVVVQDITSKRMTARPITKIWLQLGKQVTPTFTVPWATIETREWNCLVHCLLAKLHGTYVLRRTYTDGQKRS